jgi:hypothetical protein
MVPGPHTDFGVAVEDVGFAFERAEGRIGDGVGDAVS